MITVIQLFKYFKRIEKPDYTTANRSSLEAWGPRIISANGFVENEVLHLPHEAESNQLHQARLIIIQDIYDYDTATAHLYPSGLHQPLYYFPDSPKPSSFELFKAKINSQYECELSLHYSGNSSYIGIPERNDHPIAVLKKDQSIRFVINGKSDFTLTGRKQRTYLEYDYLIQNVGTVQSITYMAQNKITREKQIPFALSKMIDERKILK